MASESSYSMDMNVKFNPLELIDIKALHQAATPWSNQSLCLVNDCVVRLGVIQGDFHWHKHEREDEFFYVIEGSLLVDLEGRTVELLPQQGITVPKGVIHRTRAPRRAVILMVEASTVKPTGD